MDAETTTTEPAWYLSEDWLAVALGAVILIACFWAGEAHVRKGTPHAISQRCSKPAKWESGLSRVLKQTEAPANGNLEDGEEREQTARGGERPSGLFESMQTSTGQPHWGKNYLVVAIVSAFLFGSGLWLRGESFTAFVVGFFPLFGLAALALTLAAESTIKSWNLEYALWALGFGLLISNTVKTPLFLRPALRTEFYIKTGLVLLGAKILFSKLMYLGPRGLVVAWVVTPVVLVTTYWFGQRILRIPSKSLNMVISADMSVCGVSAAIATSAACKAKKEELSLAIGISLTFTVIMMVVLPAVIQAAGINERVGGAWLGGTIDSTGAVAAAGSMVGPEAEDAAVTIKMIQNILIGVTAFCVALYWVRFVEPQTDGARPQAMEIWYRFPKFVIGFLLASATFSILHGFLPRGPEIVDATLKQGSEIFRSWFFALAFVSIGLETDFRELSQYLKGGKPLLLYACGQSLNLVLTLLMASWMFGG